MQDAALALRVSPQVPALIQHLRYHAVVEPAAHLFPECLAEYEELCVTLRVHRLKANPVYDPLVEFVTTSVVTRDKRLEAAVAVCFNERSHLTDCRFDIADSGGATRVKP